MFIRSIELIGYKRMSLVGTGYIKVNFTERTQIIIGTNGSGKSSLLKELIPFPSEPSDFEKGGSKTLNLTHNHQEYSLCFKFHPNKYTFIRNNEVLYEGHVASVVKELCEQEFGISSEVRDIILGVTKFHAISPIKRRELFTQMSAMDYSFALGIYNKAKERKRDLSGAIKIAKKNLSVELSSILSEEELKKLRQEVNDYKELLGLLYEERSLISESSLYLEEQILDLKEKTEARGLDILKTPVVLPQHLKTTLKTKDDLVQYNDQLKDSITGKQAILDRISIEFQEKNTLLEKLKVSRIEAKESIEKRIQAHREVLERIPSTYYHFQFKYNEEAFKRFNAIKENLIEIFSQLSPNPNQRHTKESYEVFKDAVTRLKAKIEIVEKQILSIKVKIETLGANKEKEAIECPNCHIRFKAGFNESEFNKLHELYEKGLKALEIYRNQLESDEKTFNDCKNYFEYYRQFVLLQKQNPELEVIFNFLKSKEEFTSHPSALISDVEMIVKDLEYLSQKESIEKEIAILTDTLKNISDFDEVKYNALVKDVELISKTISEVTEKLNEERSILKKTFELYDTVTRLEQEQDMLNTNLKTLDDLLKKIVEVRRQESIRDLIKVLQNELTKLEVRLNDGEVRKNTIIKLEEQIANMQKEEQELGLVADTLSPTEGLIAEGLLGFINQFLKQMNTIISRIWTYPLEIKPCHVDEENPVDLDYRFPIELNNGDNTISDANQGSLGIKEVIDLAFKIIAVRYLKLSHMPLFLDEFGASFDELHRSNASSAIMYFLDELNISQLFMVSHYEESYGSLANSELLVLKGDSLAKGRKFFNQHAVFHQSP